MVKWLSSLMDSGGSHQVIIRPIPLLEPKLLTLVIISPSGILTLLLSIFWIFRLMSKIVICRYALYLPSLSLHFKLFSGEVHGTAKFEEHWKEFICKIWRMRLSLVINSEGSFLRWGTSPCCQSLREKVELFYVIEMSLKHYSLLRT